jgi:hypothetical protein
MKRWTFWLLIAAAAALLGGALTFTALGAETMPVSSVVGIAFVFTSFFASGLIILRKQPGQRIGWLLVVAAMGMYFYGFASSYASYSFLHDGGTLPLTPLITWCTTWSWAIYVWPITAGLPLFFPTGRLPSPRWRPLLWATLAFMGTVIVFYAFWPGPIGGLEPLTNPFGVPALARLPLTPEQMEGWYWPLPLLAVLSLLLRFRRAQGEERAQIKWFLYAAVLFMLWGVSNLFSQLGLLPEPGERLSSTIFTLIVGAFGAAIAVAILKYRLYDIDIIIRRTLGYSLLTALLGVLFLGGVVVLQRAFAGVTAQESQPAIVLSTLAIAALFNPLRLRIQGWIDRRFYRRKYDAQRVLERLAQAARDETDVDRILAELAHVVDDTVHPAHISIWVAGPRPDRQEAIP